MAPQDFDTAEEPLGDASCPPQTRAQRPGHCVLDQDIEIAEPLILQTGMRLNCRGHSILPVEAGVDGPVALYEPSIPEVAIALIGTRGVKIQNCVIGAPDRRIDFGVVIVDSKSSANDGNKIQGNEIHARALGVEVIASDGNLISDNVIEWDGSGVGILIGRDADRTQARENTLTSSARPASYVRTFPGMEARAAGIVDSGIFFGDAQTLFPLYSLVIGDRLVQIPDFGLPRIEDSLCEGNTISLPGPHAGKAHGGIYAALMSSRVVIRGNTVIGGRPGIRYAGAPVGTLVQFPQRCTGDPDRYCVTNADCDIPGIDLEPLGTCPPLAAPVPSDARAIEPISEGNTLIGPFGNPGGQDVLDAAIGPFGGTVGGVVRNNHVDAEGSSFGLVVSGDGILDTLTRAPGSGAVITRNVIDGAEVGITFALRQADLPTFGAHVFRNDIVHSGTFAVTSFEPTYALPTELSEGGVGNYWGHSTAPGFLASDSNNPVVVDHHPFCAPVAEQPGPPPATCP